MRLWNTLILLTTIMISGFVNSQTKEGVRYSEQKLNSPTNNIAAMQCYNSGYMEFHKENYSVAISLYRRAIQLDSNYTDAIDNLGLTYRRINNFDSAEYFYKLSIIKLPSNELAWSNLGLVYLFKDDLKQAKSIYKQLIKISPNYGDGYYQLAEVYLRENNSDSAIIYSLKAYNIWKDNNSSYAGDALFYAGLGYYNKGDLINAKKYFNLAKKCGRVIPDEISKQLNLK